MSKLTSIFLSGLPGSGKSLLAKELSKKLGWPVVSAREHWESIRKEAADAASFEDFWKNTTLEDNKAFDEIVRMQLSKGNILFDGRFPKLADGLKNTLKVFCICALSERARRASETGKYPKRIVKEIELILTQREDDEIQMSQKIYGEDFDYRDSKHYDLILRTDKMTLEEEIGLIIEKI